MSKKSAGLLLFRQPPSGLEVLLVHPGGPYWAKKDAGSWSIPKGEYTHEEEPLSAAVREFEEELGIRVAGSFIPLSAVRQRGGKVVTAWASEGTFDVDAIVSNTFEMEWPPGSGRLATFPEVDRAAWFSMEEAHQRILESQRPFLSELEAILNAD